MANKIKEAYVKEMINCRTGEVETIETRKVFHVPVDPSRFYMVFLGFVDRIIGLKGEVPFKVLSWMCEHTEYNTNRIFLTTKQRKALCKDLDISNNVLTNNLKKLKDNNLICGEQGNFTINPEIIWKGDVEMRRQMLKDNNLKVTFDIDNNEESDSSSR